MQCLFLNTAMEDWTPQNYEEPFHSQVSIFKTLGKQQRKQKTSLCLHYTCLVATD